MERDYEQTLDMLCTRLHNAFGNYFIWDDETYAHLVAVTVYAIMEKDCDDILTHYGLWHTRRYVDMPDGNRGVIFFFNRDYSGEAWLEYQKSF